MIPRVIELPPSEDTRTGGAEPGLGSLRTEQGNLPLRALDVDCRVVGLTARTTITQTFHNPSDTPIEATYIFPLPDRAAVTAMSMVVGDRTVTATLQERAEARRRYTEAVTQGKRAAIAEAERADVFTMRVGNILPRGEATVTVTLLGPLGYADGEATLRVPLVVAPRYIPGEPIPGPPAGDGHAEDTDAVPDASRITPPVLLPGFPNPIALSIAVDIDPGGFGLPTVRSSLHTVDETQGDDGHVRLRVRPGERVNRDFILRLAYADDDRVTDTATVVDEPDSDNGTFQLTVLPPARPDAPSRPRDVVVLLDRSGSMRGWKMVAARRAAARIVDTLSEHDRFAVRCFDTELTAPDGLGDGLAPGNDHNRFRAVEHLARTDSRGGTKLLEPLVTATGLLGSGEPGRDRAIVLVTDGQVGNEDQILAELQPRLAGTRIHVVGIDRAVNAGFLHRLALAGRGRCELVESEDRLDAATAHIHRRIVAPEITDLAVTAEGVALDTDSMSPRPLGDLYTGAPLVVSGRYRRTGAADPVFTVTGTDADGRPWHTTVPARVSTEPAIPASWARARLRDLEDRYATAPRRTDVSGLEKTIVDTSLTYQVLSRFTAFVAIDTTVVTEGGKPRTVVQPVELPDGWELPPSPGPVAGAQSFGTMNMVAAAGPMAAPAGPARARAGFNAAPRGAPAPVNRRAGGAPASTGRARRRGELDAVQLARIAAEELRALTTDLDDVEPSRLDRERRMRLSDLATRLTAVLPETDSGTEAAPQIVTRLRELAADLAGCESPAPPTGADLDALWRRTISTLTELTAEPADDAPDGDQAADSAGPTGSSEADTGSAPGTAGDFWKRRPGT